MNSTLSPKDFPWRRSRLGYAVFFFCSLLASCFVLRIVLLARFGPRPAASALAVIEVFLIGFQRDFFIALGTTLWLLLLLWIIPERWFSRMWLRIPFIGMALVFWAAQFFLFFTEYYFFEEFRSRFNTVAVDYLLYPTEVFGNIRDSYPVGTVLAVCAGLSVAWAVIAFRYFRQMWHQPTSASSRFRSLAAATVLFGIIWPTLGLPQSGPVENAARRRSFGERLMSSLQTAHFSEDRTLNEIANNGTISFIDAALTRDLDYSAYYKTMPPDEAFQRVRHLLAGANSQFTDPGRSIRRHIAGDAIRPKLNVIILLEESLGSEFWGCLGRPKTLTPEMDKLALGAGMLFTNIYACGNRTVRGFEGVLSSFPPLPGDSIVKRDHSDDVESVARVLKRDGYSTVFLYGGRGFFDNMRSFTVRNGYDRFIEQKDFPNPTFATIWGVCDEDVYKRGLEEFRALAQKGKPFLGTIMTVSNHKPYTYPRGRIPEDPYLPGRDRNKAVKYSDWCLGQFFRMAKQESFWTNTIFVVVADHGARVYGEEDIPIFSYEIPLVILGPAVVKEPQQIGVLGSSLDVTPTVLGMIGRPYDTMFFGRDLLHDPPEGGRALLNHNRDIGMYIDSRMVVLGLEKTVEYYAGDPKRTELTPHPEATPGYVELEKNATALYQVADDLYMHELYHLDGAPPAGQQTAKAQPPAAPAAP